LWSPGSCGRSCHGSGSGGLPGDILFQRGGATFYFPLVTSIIISIVLSVLSWLFYR
jgi:hypothetical protein